MINFPIKNSDAATMDLVQENGIPVPTGTEITIDAADINNREKFVVGDQGLVYLSGLREETTLYARWKNGECRAKIHYIAEKGSIPHLGRQRCETVRKH